MSFNIIFVLFLSYTSGIPIRYLCVYPHSLQGLLSLTVATNIFNTNPSSTAFPIVE